MTDAPISPLRRRMIEDMTVRKLAARTLRKPAIVLDMPFVREPRRLPVVLSPDEVARLLDAAPGFKYKAAPSVAYGAGLRASEGISLKSLPPRRRGSPTSTAARLVEGSAAAGPAVSRGSALTHHRHVHCIAPGGGS
jgi:hypothetical protein